MNRLAWEPRRQKIDYEANLLARADIQAHHQSNRQTENVESGDDTDDGHDESGIVTADTKSGILIPRRVAFKEGGD